MFASYTDPVLPLVEKEKKNGQLSEDERELMDRTSLKLQSITQVMNDFNISQLEDSATGGSELAQIIIKRLTKRFKKVYNAKKLQKAEIVKAKRQIKENKPD